MTNLTRLRWLSGLAVVVTVTAALLLQHPAPVSSTQVAGEDTIAERFLAGVRGSSPLACEMLLRSLGIGWGWSYLDTNGISSDLVETLVWSTGRPRDHAVVPVLRAGLEDSDACVRRVSARLLGRTTDPAALRTLLDELSNPNEQTRALAAIGLGYSENPAAVEPLIDALGDPAPPVRAAAARALGQIEDHRALDPLAALLRDDPDPSVRRAAAVALGNLF